MRLKKASLTFAGAAAAVALTTMAASPAWACNDRDPALKLNSACGKAGAPNWMVSNPNGWGAVPFTWSDDKGGHSEGKMSAPANGSVALPTHASKVIVIAYRSGPARPAGLEEPRRGRCAEVRAEQADQPAVAQAAAEADGEADHRGAEHPAPGGRGRSRDPREGAAAVHRLTTIEKAGPGAVLFPGRPFHRRHRGVARCQAGQDRGRPS